MAMLDSIDERLIQLLEQDARQSSESLAQKLNVSSTTVRRRTRKLIQSGILRTVAIVDRKKVGFPLCAIIAFDAAHDKLESIMQNLSDRPQVKLVSTTTGRFDIVILAWFRTTDELSEFVQRDLANIEGVRDTETFICLRVQKGLYDTSLV